jgi:hypothetical protein
MRFCLIAIATLLLSCAAHVADRAGTWKMNPAKSTIPETSSLIDITEKIEQTGPITFRITDDVVTKSGKVHEEFTAICDGKEHPLTGVGVQSGASGICEINGSTFTGRSITDGKETGTLTSRISDDGKVMTNTGTGAFAGTQVFDKQP